MDLIPSMKIILKASLITFEPAQRLLWLSITGSSWSIRIVPADSIEIGETQPSARPGAQAAFSENGTAREIEQKSREVVASFPSMSQVDLSAVPSIYKVLVDFGDPSSLRFLAGERYVVSGLGVTAWDEKVTAE